jgi:UDP-GlcNAc:undecaprenyl-phosphate GlcNAc-1-phosphate transferase
MYLFLSIALLLQATIYFQSEKLAHKFNLYDFPDQETKTHKRPTPLIGGLGLIIISFGYIFFDIYIYGLDREIIAILLIISSLSILGILDDKYSYKGNNKLIIVFIFTLIFFLISHHHFKIDFLNFFILNENVLIFNLWYFILPFSFTFLIFSLNISDGKNGLVTSFSFVLLLILYFSYPNLEYKNYLVFILFGLFLVFLFNFNGKLFLGSSGVNIIAVSIFLIIVKIYKHNEVYIEEIILIYFVHVFEVLRLFFSRIYSNRDPFKRDINHLHNFIFKKFNQTIAIIIYNFISFFPFIIYKFTQISLILSFLIALFLYTVSIIYCKKI